MGVKGSIVGLLSALFLTACGTSWSVDYPESVPAEVSSDWRLSAVISIVPDTLKVSNDNTYLPNADIVWWGEPFGDRRAQVARIMEEAVTSATSDLDGKRPVTFTVTTQTFHAVTPAAVAAAPSAVHNIKFNIQVFDAKTAEELTPVIPISADLEAYVQEAATAAAIRGETQRSRIVDHVESVVRGWLGNGPDQRRTFRSVGR